MLFRKLWTVGLTITLAVLTPQAKTQKYAPPAPLTPQQSALIQKMIDREKATVVAIMQRAPVVETYIQNMRPDPKLDAVPDSDTYLLGLVDFGKSFVQKGYENRDAAHGFFRGSLKHVSNLTNAFHLSYSPTGFVAMMFPDSSSFNQQVYDFSYVRREFLGSVRTVVFDVRPKPKAGVGRFVGRIWVEDQDGNIVRFNGTYTAHNTYTEDKNEGSSRYFHFDSWRQNVQPGVWLPVAIYAEEAKGGAGRKGDGFRGQTHFWGYSLKLPTHESDAESITVENAQDQSENTQDISPLAARRQWISEAENNVLDRLVQAGLIAPPSDFDKVLETVTNNIIIGNKLELPSDIHCRVMLTSPLESLAVGNTILLSKGLVDVLPTEEDLAAVISFQLAHIVLGHHIDTRYAFNDRMFFPDESTFQRINMNHTAIDNEAAGKKAQEFFNGSIYHDKSASVGLFYQQVVDRAKQVPALLTPRLGDPLLKADGTPWTPAFLQGPKLNMEDVRQERGALPLGSHLKTDAWDDKVIAVNLKGDRIVNPSDKMPLELMPVYFRLLRYQVAAAAPSTANAPQLQQQIQGQDPASDGSVPKASQQSPQKPQ